MLNALNKYTLTIGTSWLLAGAAAHAADGQIEFIGSVTDSACTITTSNANKTVSLDPVQLSSFGPEVGSVAGEKAFSITLDNCSTATLKKASITFDGQQDISDSTLLGLIGDNQVPGIAIRISDARTGTKIALNEPTADYALRSQSNTFDFKAAYVRTIADTKDSDGKVTQSGIGTGQVHALANFVVSYK